MGIVHETVTDRIRLPFSKELKIYMEKEYGIYERFTYLKNKIFRNTEHIKQFHIYPPEKGRCTVIAVYETTDREYIPENRHYLSIDLEPHNLIT